MSEEKTKLEGPDLAQGVALSTLAEGAMLLGHTQGEPLILVRRGGELFAIGAVCTHYNGPLAEGLLVGETVRCPWREPGYARRLGQQFGRMLQDVRRQGAQKHYAGDLLQPTNQELGDPVLALLMSIGQLT